MLKRIKSRIISDVIDTPPDDFKSATLDGRLKDFDEVLQEKMPGDWKLLITYFFVGVDHIGVAKRQVTVSIEKEIRFTFLMPVPTVDQSKIGLPKKNFPKFNYGDILEQAYIVDDINFEQFDSLGDLFIWSVDKNLKLLRAKGIKVRKEIIH